MDFINVNFLVRLQFLKPLNPELYLIWYCYIAPLAIPGINYCAIVVVSCTPT